MKCQVANCERVVRDGFARCDEHTEALFIPAGRAPGGARRHRTEAA